MKFDNQAMRRWKGTKVQKLIIYIEELCEDGFDDDIDAAHAWPLFALKNNLEELEIVAPPDYSVPQDLYSSSSIRRLYLCCEVGFLGTPSWNQLKSLTLAPILLDCNIEGLVNQIMLGSPVLEVVELDLHEYDYDNLNIVSRSLKRLKICIDVFLEDDTLPKTLSVCSPNLETLEINGLFKCLFTDVSSLADASLGFYNRYDNRDHGSLIELLGENLKQIFTSIQNVEKLALTVFFVQAFGASRKKYLLSSLPNVKFLKLDAYVCYMEYGDVIDLLGIFPNLKYFIFEERVFRKPHVFSTVNYMEFETNISKSFLLQLKIVEINAHAQLFDSSAFGFIEFLLEHAVMLDKLVVWPKGITLVEHKMLLEKLLSMPRFSRTARVILKSD